MKVQRVCRVRGLGGTEMYSFFSFLFSNPFNHSSAPPAQHQPQQSTYTTPFSSPFASRSLLPPLSILVDISDFTLTHKFYLFLFKHTGGGLMSGFASTIAQGFAFGTGSAVAHRVRCLFFVLQE